MKSLATASYAAFFIFVLQIARSTAGAFLAPARAFAPVATAGSAVVRSRSSYLHSPPFFSLQVQQQLIAAATTTITETDLPIAESANADRQPIGKLVFLVPENADSVPSKFGASSPVGNPSLLEAVNHLGQKAFYFANGLLEWDVVVAKRNNDRNEEQHESLYNCEILIAVALQSPDEIAFAKEIFEARRQLDPAIRNRLCHFSLESAEQLPALVGPFDETQPSLAATLLPWTEDATACRMHAQMLDLFSRWTSDDFGYAFMLFLNQFSGSPVDWVKHRTDASWEKGPVKNAQELYGMVTECGDCVKACVQDDQCRECLTKLTQVDPRDQAASYRTLVSYESDLLTQFSLCVFTKKNIFNCDATIPTLPRVTPLTTWRGRALTEADGRALLVGHLDDEAAPEGSRRTPVSWKVACGANVAYDQFPSQNQLFYPAARGRDMWYDPVFRVETLDGRHVWCKRHYKVRPGPDDLPGTFRLSVSDNGVTSDEFWTILGAADDLSWVVFHYAGAAKTVGLQYLGGLLCTPDGSLPDEETERSKIWDCFRSAGIQPWELYKVDNRSDTPAAVAAGPPPLDFYRRSVLERRAAAAATPKQ